MGGKKTGGWLELFREIEKERSSAARRLRFASRPRREGRRIERGSSPLWQRLEETDTHYESLHVIRTSRRAKGAALAAPAVPARRPSGTCGPRSSRRITSRGANLARLAWRPRSGRRDRCVQHEAARANGSGCPHPLRQKVSLVIRPDASTGELQSFDRGVNPPGSAPLPPGCEICPGQALARALAAGQRWRRRPPRA